MPRGMPMMERNSGTAVMTWPMAIHKPASRNQITFARAMPTLSPPGFVTTARPNGQRA
jgi:hypothetical protein